jgi:DNA-binding NarL/FixJ family response regulator
MNAAAKLAGGNGHSRPSLLIADDDPVVRSALRAQLAHDFNVIAVAENALGAIELVEQHRPDAALVDVDMPFGGAPAAVPQMARRSPDTCIVILSGDEAPRVVLELLEAGAVAYIRKGVTGAQISETLTEALKAHADRRPA